MRYSSNPDTASRQFNRKWIPALLLLALVHLKSSAQDCPPNLDFENGTFDGWTCYIGGTAALNGENVISLVPNAIPVPNRHTMYTNNGSGGLDPYGGFPVNCPNGSGHSIRLGNDLAGTEAEGIAYEFTIPANRNTYALIYHYAVVFQDPNHLPIEQPRMEIEIKNLTDNEIISCASFTFYPYGSLLPGFYESPNPGGDTPVWCKDWSAVSINLDGMAGKTIRLFFKTADCTFRRHFGYAYIDVNSECSGEFVGAAFCRDDTAVNVVAPYGYQSYTWFNSSFSDVLGTQQTLTLRPPPAPGTMVAVEVLPFHGYGCPDTLFARLLDTLTLTAHAGSDTYSCNKDPVKIGLNPKPGIVYSWSPVVGLSNASIANPMASPDTTTVYVLTVRSSGGGCVDRDEVQVRAIGADNSLRLSGEDSFCFGSGDSAILHVNPASHIQWYRDNRPISGATSPDLKVVQTGTYHAELSTVEGCLATTGPQKIYVEIPKPGMYYPVQYALINSPLTLQARSFGETAEWTPGRFLNDTSTYTPIFTGPSEQLYTIKITTAAGCVTLDTLLVKTVKSVEMYVPTAFTPNNDGLNDFLKPILMGVKELRYFKIFNRWGQLVYESRTDRPGWDGKISGMLMPTQVVAWIVQGIGVDGKTYTRKGTTVLIQ